MGGHLMDTLTVRVTHMLASLATARFRLAGPERIVGHSDTSVGRQSMAARTASHRALRKVVASR